jgi:prepilin-type N-terminal cleavage/methylation domain-containing protein/prepilin-type processing-associated H-X9-DG protein
MIKSSPPRCERAFTLIELLVVIATITILVALAVPVFYSTLEHAKVTQDMSNLRQIGAATQMYMNDNNGVLFSTTASWMSQINPKYSSSWEVFQSPFDRRPASEAGDSNTPVSYGVNQNVWGQLADKITKPTSFIVFAPTQDNSTTVHFQGTAATPVSQGITVLAATSSPGGTATGGTHNSRTKINVLFADWHTETMPWSGTGPAFTNSTATSTDPDGRLRWYLQ